MQNLRWKLYIIVTAPLEIIGCAGMGAYEGVKDACANIQEAWRSHRRLDS